VGDSTPRPDLALVLSGGGARAAYQVGFLRLLTHEFPEIVPGILTGVSAGGINAAYLAAKPEPFAEKIANLASIWAGLSIEDVFRVDLRDLAGRTLRWGGRLTAGGASPLPAAKSLVDTAPLRVLLERVLEADGGVLAGIGDNLAADRLRAIALTPPTTRPASRSPGCRRATTAASRPGSGRSARARPARCASIT
jgi:NTE family protein